MTKYIKEWFAAAGRAAVFSAVLLVGYRAAYDLLHRPRQFAFLSGFNWTAPAVEQLDAKHYMHQVMLGMPPMNKVEWRWIDIADTAYWVPIWFVLFLLGALGALISLYCPLRLAPNRVYLAPAPAKSEIGVHWRRALRTRTSWYTLLSVGLAVGVAAFVIGDLYRLVITALVNHGITFGRFQPVTDSVFGFLGAWDGMVLLITASLVPGLSKILAARSRFHRDEEVTSRWCLWCGYPRVSRPDVLGDTERDLRCPECGRTPGAIRRTLPTWSRERVVVIAISTIVLMGVLFWRAPSLIYRVVGVELADGDPMLETHDRVILDAEAVIRVERPGVTLWFRLERFPRDKPGNVDRYVLRVVAESEARDTPPEQIAVLTLHQTDTASNPYRYETYSGVLELPSGEVIEYEALWGASAMPIRLGMQLRLYLSPRSSTSIRVVPEDHRVFDKP